MRKLLSVFVATGVMAAAGMAVTAPAEAHGCCTYYKKVRFYQPVYTTVKKVRYERVRGYRTVYRKKLYRDRCGCRKFYRTVAYRKPVVTVVPRVEYVKVRSYRTVWKKRLYRRRCCCN